MNRDQDEVARPARRHALRMATGLLAMPVLVSRAGDAQAQDPSRPTRNGDRGGYPLSASDIGAVQLLFVDLQPSLIAQSRTNPPGTIARSSAALAAAAVIVDLPMTFLTVPQDGKPGVLLPELQRHATAENSFSRSVTGPFLVPRIASAIASHRRKILIVAGFATEVAVVQTSLGALDAGYQVFVAVDCVGSRSDRTEEATFREIERAGGITASVRSLMLRLTPDLSRVPGSEVMKAPGTV